MSFDSVADGLYGLTPERFVSERTAAEKQARNAGNRPLALQIHALGKPTIVGWLANQLVRRHPEEIGPLLELGAGLREATATLSRAKLQELTRLQHQVIAGLIKQARQLARDAGQRISEDGVRGLEETIRAALADEALGEQLRAGRLTGGLEHVGFSGIPAFAVGSDAAAPPKVVARKKASDEAVNRAQSEADAAADADERAQSTLDAAAAALGSLTEKVAQLQQAVLDARSAAELTHTEATRRRQQLAELKAERDGLSATD